MAETPKEVKLGDGGYTLSEGGDVLPPEDGSYQDELELWPSDPNDNYPELEFTPETKEKETQQQRLAHVYQQYGFLPRSAEELNYIVGIDRHGRGAASYIAWIMRHQVQSGHEDKTTRTASSILSDFSSYFKDAEPVNFFLGDVVFEVRDASLENDPPIESFAKADSGPGRAFSQVVRRYDMLKFLTSDSTDRKYVFKEDKAYRSQLPEYLESMNYDTLLNSIVQAQTEEQNRIDFWKAQIEDAQKKVTSLGSEAARRIVEN